MRSGGERSQQVDRLRGIQGGGLQESELPEAVRKGEVFTGVGEDRRCITCHVYRRDHNQTDRPRELVEAAIAVRESKGHECKNTNCLKPAGRGEFRL